MPDPRTGHQSPKNFAPPRGARNRISPGLTLIGCALLVFCFGVAISCSSQFHSCKDTYSCVDAGAGAAAGARDSGDSAAGVPGTDLGGSSAAGAGAAASDAAGAGGEADTGPCAGACGGATPACDPATNTCVECESNRDCGSAKPVCIMATNRCVECARSSECLGKNSICNTTLNVCEECAKQADCFDPKASTCENGVCKACTADADCGYIENKTACNAGECVQCTVANETACGGNSCDPKTNECTTTAVGTTSNCHSCVADSECISHGACVPMTLMGSPRPGGYCLPTSVSKGLKLFTSRITAVSLSGAASATYLSVDTDYTTCEAVLDLVAGAACVDGQNISCGCSRDIDGKCTSPGEGGLCKTVQGVANKCTFACALSSECVQPTLCVDGYCQ